MELPFSESIKNLKIQNAQLKWVIAQFMQRHGVTESTFMKNNKRRFGLSVDDYTDRIIIKVIERKDDEEVTDSDGKSGLN